MKTALIILIFILARAIQVWNGLLFAKFLENSTGIWLVVASVVFISSLQLAKKLIPDRKKLLRTVYGALILFVLATIFSAPVYFVGFLFAAFFFVFLNAEETFQTAFADSLGISRGVSAAVALALFLPGQFLGQRFGMHVDMRYVIIFAVAEWILLTIGKNEQGADEMVHKTTDPPFFMALLFIAFPVGFYFVIRASGDPGVAPPFVLISALGMFYVAGMMMLYFSFARWVRQLAGNKSDIL